VPLIFIEVFFILLYAPLVLIAIVFELFTALFSGLYSVRQRHLAVMFRTTCSAI